MRNALALIGRIREVQNPKFKVVTETRLVTTKKSGTLKKERLGLARASLILPRPCRGIRSMMS